MRFSLLSPSSKNHGAHYALVFALDAGRGSFSAAAIEYTHKNKPRVLSFVTGEDLPGETGSDLGAKTLEALEKATAELSKHFPHGALPRRGGKAVCVLAAPFYTAKTSILKYRSKEPILITEDLIDTLVASRNKLDSNGKSSVIARKILGVVINGYATSNPVGKKGTSLEVHYFESITPESLISRIKKAVEPKINIPLSFEPASLSAFISLRDEFKAPENFLMLLPGKKVTELSLVRDSLLRSTVSFPIGTEKLQHISQSVSKEDGRSLKILKERQHSSETATSAEISTPPVDWIKSLNASLAELEEGGPLPPVFYALDSFGAGAYINLFKTPTNYGLRLPFGASLQPISEKDIQAVFDTSQDSFPDSAALLAALYVEHTF